MSKALIEREATVYVDDTRRYFLHYRDSTGRRYTKLLKADTEAAAKHEAAAFLGIKPEHIS